MARRPVFVPSLDLPYFASRDFEFRWHPGFALAQKRRNIEALHESAGAAGVAPVLEVSSKSAEKMGTTLSAFNLVIGLADGREVPLENVFQSSKVFRDAGPFPDLLDVPPRDAKRDPRLRSSGPLVAFRFAGIDWPLEPRTVFYDWLYLGALLPQRERLGSLLDYAGFTDIEFNPGRSINCQARSCAILASLLGSGRLDEVMASPEAFLAATGAAGHHVVEDESTPRQGRLFE